MKNLPILSICIPIYNRKKKLLKLLKTIDLFSNIEIVITDDGSTDNVKSILKKENYPFKIKYLRTNINRGRSSALADSIKFSSGKFIIIMDSDDHFLKGSINVIISNIKKHQNVKCFVYGIQTLKDKIIQNKLPPRGLKTNLLKLRADYCVKHDLKEIVRSDILKKSIYKKAYIYRRTPTSLMWFNVSSYCKSLTFDIPIVFKKYEKSGMTSLISNLKYENAKPMRDIYYKYSKSKLYNSVFFRVRSKIQFYRYSFLSKIKFKFYINQLIYILIGYMIHIFDFVNYNFFNKKKL